MNIMASSCKCFFRRRSICLATTALLSYGPFMSAAIAAYPGTPPYLGVPKALNATWTDVTNNLTVSFVEGQLEYEIGWASNVHAQVPIVNKITLVVLSSFLGLCGCDRLYARSYVTGLLKFFTVGGFGFWAFLDFLVVSVNALERSPDIQVFGFSAKFQKESIPAAHTTAVFCLAFHTLMTVAWFFAKRRQPEAVVLVRNQSVARMPNLISSALRSQGLIPDKPSVPELKALFQALDTNGNGQLDKVELKSGLKYCLEDIGCSEAQIDVLIEQADLDGDGQINLSEFIAALKRDEDGA